MSGPIETQARAAYAAALDSLARSGRSPSEVTRVSEHVAIAALVDYDTVAGVRAELLAGLDPAVRTVVVERFEDPGTLLQVELDTGAADGAVHLPTVLPVDERGDLLHPGDFVAQYAACLVRAGELLEQLGLSLDHAVTTYDYSTPETRSVYRRTHRVRRDLLGGAGVYPGAGGILMSRMRHPGALVAIDVTASRHPLELVNPGWSRYDTLTYAPGVRAGRTLYMSGFAALDMETQEALHPGDLAAQAEATYACVLELVTHAGLGPADVVETTEYVVASALAEHAVVADVRRALLGTPGPVVSGGVCAELLRPEFLLEVFPTARYPEPGTP